MKLNGFRVWLTSEENNALWNSVNSLLQQISVPGSMSASTQSARIGQT